MARRRSGARPRRRTPVKRRSRGGKGSSDWLLWLVAAIVLVVVAERLVDVVTANWPLVLGVTIVMAAGLAGTLLLRYRMLEARRHEWLRDNAHLERVDRMTGDQFELLVEALLRREGFRKIHRIGGSGDGGVDVIGTAPTGDLFVIQCKRWTNSVGSPEIRNLLGALHAYPHHRGVLATSAGFTAPARQVAAGTNLILIDRALLTTWLTGSYTLVPAGRATGSGWPFRRPVAPPIAVDLGLGGALDD